MKRLEQYRKNMRAWQDRTDSRTDEQRNRTALAIAFGIAAVALAILVWSAACGAGERTPRLLRVTATAYCPCAICTDGDGKTATGRDASKRGVAVDPSVIALGARLDIPGAGAWIKADDVGGAIKGNRIDYRDENWTHDQAKAWGRRVVVVRIWE
jgi:3D (Asp-Asp-Asp) domain-containing protein